MNPAQLILTSLLICIAATTGSAADAAPDPELELLQRQYEREKLELTVRLNSAYIEKYEARLKKAMKQEDLAAANLADRRLKQLRAENQALIARRESEDLVASLAGDWEIATTRWRFRVFPDGRVISIDADDPYLGQMVVVDLEKRLVRFNKVVWTVTEGSESLHDARHPARRLNPERPQRRPIRETPTAGLGR